MTAMRRDPDTATMGALRARKTALRVAMEFLYPRLRVRRKHKPQPRPGLNYVPRMEGMPLVQSVRPRDDLFTVLASCGVAGAAVALVMMFTRMDLLK